jgi:toxin ParE1/3/4
MPGYIISKEAIKDINDIWMYTAEKWSVEQADRYYNLILDEIEYVVGNFQMARDFSRVKKNYRYSKVKSHLIFSKKSVLI